jgi:hypothetical protein
LQGGECLARTHSSGPLKVLGRAKATLNINCGLRHRKDKPGVGATDDTVKITAVLQRDSHGQNYIYTRRDDIRAAQVT